MSGPPTIPRLERPDFAHGQRLLPEDMQALSGFQRSVRWLHNRTLHDWGIALGFGVQGAKGEREVVIEPGYALDCLGHDIVLSDPVRLQVPAVAGAPTGGARTYLLTASWLPDDELATGESRRGVCEGGGVVRRPEAPLLRWQDPHAVSPPEARYRRGLDLVLASVEVEDCALASDPSGTRRRSARVETKPYVIAGRSEAASTLWTFFPGTGTRVGIETTVDTSEAGFQRTPNYFAQLRGTRLVSSPVGGSVPGVLVEGFATVVEPRPEVFKVRVTLPRDLTVPGYQVNPPSVFEDSMLARFRNELLWHISWIGIEG